MSAEGAPARTGDIIADRFAIEAKVASGGTSVVYSAQDLQSGLPVVLKLLDRQGDATGDYFLREADLLADMIHPSTLAEIHRRGMVHRDLKLSKLSSRVGTGYPTRLGRTDLAPAGLAQAAAGIAQEVARASDRHPDVAPAVGRVLAALGGGRQARRGRRDRPRGLPPSESRRRRGPRLLPVRGEPGPAAGRRRPRAHAAAR